MSFKIPKAAQAEARKALAWRRDTGRGGTSVGLNTARTLAAGGTIGIEKVRHIARYFPRHEVDKKGKGWKPGEDGFPSNGRIAWALWGGDPAWRWAADIVERESVKNRSRSREEERAIFAKMRGGYAGPRSPRPAEDKAAASTPSPSADDSASADESVSADESGTSPVSSTPTSPSQAPQPTDDSAESTIPANDLNAIEKFAEWVSQLGADETPPEEYLKHLQDIQEGREDFIEGALTFGNPITSAATTTQNILESENETELVVAALALIPGIKGPTGKLISDFLKGPIGQILQAGGLAAAAAAINEHRSNNPDMSPEEKKAWALLEQGIEYAAVIKGLNSIKKVTKHLIGTKGLNAIQGVKDYISQAIKSLQSKIKGGLPPALAAALSKYESFYQTAADWTGKTFQDLMGIAGVPATYQRLQTKQAQLDHLKQYAINPVTGKYGNPAEERKAKILEKTIAALQKQIQDKALAAGLVVGGASAKLVYEEYEIDRLKDEARAKLDAGEQWTFDYTEERSPAEIVLETYLSTYGNALEKQFRPDRYPAETAGYRAQWEQIADAEASGRIDAEQASKLRQQLAENEPYNMQGKSLWTIAPSIASYLAWQLSDVAKAYGSRTVDELQRLRDADTLESEKFPEGLRFIDFNAPETPKDPSSVTETNLVDRERKIRGEPLGEEAYQRAQELLEPGQAFRAVSYGDTDKYGRALAYVETLPQPFDILLQIPGVGRAIPDWMVTDVGQTLLSEGYGDTRYRELPGERPRGRDYDAARAEAQAAQAGVWNPSLAGNPDLSWVGTARNISNPSTNMTALVQALETASNIGGYGMMASGNVGAFRGLSPEAIQGIVTPWNAAVAIASSIAQEGRAPYQQDIRVRPLPGLPTEAQAEYQSVSDEIARRRNAQ